MVRRFIDSVINNGNGDAASDCDTCGSLDNAAACNNNAGGSLPASDFHTCGSGNTAGLKRTGEPLVHWRTDGLVLREATPL
jgi:hypothetical protein